MKKTLCIFVFLMTGVVLGSQPSSIGSQRMLKSPKFELAELEAKVAAAKEAGTAVDPLWLERMNQLVPLIKGHPGNIKLDPSALPNTYRTLDEDSFGPRAIIRPQDLSPLEQQIRDLKVELMAGNFGAAPDPVLFANYKEQLNELYAQRPENQPRRNPLDQGNDTCPATVIPGVPYTDSGTTAGANNDFSPINPCGFANAPDVIYSFTPDVTQTYFISLVGSSYDTYLYVNTTGACPGSVQVGCNDDSFYGLQSFLSLDLVAGQTYFIVVDGFSTSSGDYQLNVAASCEVECQPTDILECADEAPVPGNEATDCNGGCLNVIWGGVDSYQTLLPSQTVCGRGFTYLSNSGFDYRDVDTYLFTLAEPCSLAITVSTTLGVEVEVTEGVCPEAVLFDRSARTDYCSSTTFITQCFQPGTYRIFVLPPTTASWYGTHNYRMRYDLIPCSGCRIDAFLQAPGSVMGNTCGAGDDNPLRPSEDYTVSVNIPHESDWSFSLCNDDSLWDSYLFLTELCSGNVLASNDDGCGGTYLSAIGCTHLTAGTYYVTVEGFSVNRCGPFNLRVDECVGSCCYGPPDNLSCQYVSLTECNALAGQFTLAEPCSLGACYVRPGCSDPATTLYSQQPRVPDEHHYSLYSDVDTFYRCYDSFSASGGPIGSVRFWGLWIDPDVGGEAVPSPAAFQILFVDSVNNETCTYDVSLTGTPTGLYYVYDYPYQAYQYDVNLPTPCNITDGWISIYGTDSCGCAFSWLDSPFGDGTCIQTSSQGPTNQATIDLAFCLGSYCAAPDSVTIELMPNQPDYYTLRWWQHAGIAQVWYSSDPNAVFPATYSLLSSGPGPEGQNQLDFYTPNPALSDFRFVVTVNCTSNIEQPIGDPQIQIIDNPFIKPLPVQR